MFECSSFLSNLRIHPSFFCKPHFSAAVSSSQQDLESSVLCLCTFFFRTCVEEYRYVFCWNWPNHDWGPSKEVKGQLSVLVTFSHGSSMALWMSLVSRSVSPPLWSRLIFLKTHWMDCDEFLSRHSCSPEDEACWFEWSPDFFSCTSYGQSFLYLNL